jgi:hypothetical protein
MTDKEYVKPNQTKRPQRVIHKKKGSATVIVHNHGSEEV